MNFKKEEQNQRIEILLNTYDALLGRVSPNVRLIQIDWGVNFYYIRAYFDRPTNNEDFDDFSAVSAEVIASFPQVNDVKEEVIYSMKPLSELPVLRELVFLRKGELDSSA